ncbi:hypothetical protein JTB14_030707 [Gonioctena quinquepunctata]|nr:hypothetical protein JTB14_030707 [Gonioctena quinquepunctata]
METKRICNFSKLETDTLMTLVKKYKDVVECKKSDAVKWKEKLNAWEEIRNDNLNDNNLDNETVHEETSAELQWSSWNPSDLRRRTSSPLRVEGAVEDPHTSGYAGNIKGKNGK